MPHFECSSVLNRHPPMMARGHFLLWLLPEYCRTVLHSAALLYWKKGFRWKMRLWQTISITRRRELLCVCVRKKEALHTLWWKRKVTLTLLLTLAELLTEILGHHTRAGAVAWMFGVITWLVFVHLIGRAIWSNRGHTFQIGTVNCVVLQISFFSVNVPFFSWIFAHNLPH